MGDLTTAIRREVLSHTARLTPEVPVARRLLVDGGAKLEALLDGIGAQVEDLPYSLGDDAIGHGDV